MPSRKERKMHIAEKTEQRRDVDLHTIYQRLDMMNNSLSNEDYFHVLEGMISQARESIQNEDDPSVQEHLSQEYREMIDYALQLKLNGMELDENSALPYLFSAI